MLLFRYAEVCASTFSNVLRVRVTWPVESRKCILAGCDDGTSYNPVRRRVWLVLFPSVSFWRIPSVNSTTGRTVAGASRQAQPRHATARHSRATPCRHCRKSRCMLVVMGVPVQSIKHPACLCLVRFELSLADAVRKLKSLSCRPADKNDVHAATRHSFFAIPHDGLSSANATL